MKILNTINTGFWLLLLIKDVKHTNRGGSVIIIKSENLKKDKAKYNKNGWILIGAIYIPKSLSAKSKILKYINKKTQKVRGQRSKASLIYAISDVYKLDLYMDFAKIFNIDEKDFTLHYGKS